MISYVPSSKIIIKSWIIIPFQATAGEKGFGDWRMIYIIVSCSEIFYTEIKKIQYLGGLPWQ